MTYTVQKSLEITGGYDTLWEYVSNFSDASHQTIGVKNTQTTGNTRLVEYKNGHQVGEELIKNENGEIIWKQHTTKGSIPIYDVENHIRIEKGENSSTLHYIFHYKVKMGPIGMMMNMLMISKKLSGYAEQNLKHIERKVIS